MLSTVRCGTGSDCQLEAGTFMNALYHVLEADCCQQKPVALKGMLYLTCYTEYYQEAGTSMDVLYHA